MLALASNDDCFNHDREAIEPTCVYHSQPGRAMMVMVKEQCRYHVSSFCESAKIRCRFALKAGVAE